MLPTLWTDRFKCINWCRWHTAGLASHSGASSIRAKLLCSQASSEHLPTIIAFTTSLLRSTNQEPKDQEWTELFYLVNVNVCFLKEPWNIYIQSPTKIKTRCEPAYQIIQLNTVVSLYHRQIFWSESYQTTNNPHPKFHDTDTPDLGV